MAYPASDPSRLLGVRGTAYEPSGVQQPSPSGDLLQAHSDSISRTLNRLVDLRSNLEKLSDRVLGPRPMPADGCAPPKVEPSGMIPRLNVSMSSVHNLLDDVEELAVYLGRL